MLWVSVGLDRQLAVCSESTRRGLQVSVGIRGREGPRQQLQAGRKFLLQTSDLSVGIQCWRTEIFQEEVNLLQSRVRL